MERVWPKRVIKKMYKTEEFDREQDETDTDKKMYSQEQRTAKMEKKLISIIMVAAIVGWMFFVQNWVIEHFYN